MVVVFKDDITKDATHVVVENDFANNSDDTPLISLLILLPRLWFFFVSTGVDAIFVSAVATRACGIEENGVGDEQEPKPGLQDMNHFAHSL